MMNELMFSHADSQTGASASEQQTERALQPDPRFHFEMLSVAGMK